MLAKVIKEYINILTKNKNTAEKDSITTDNEFIEVYEKGKIVAYDQAIFYLNLLYREETRNENDQQ